MKVKIDLPAFALYTGKMGGVPFVDGVSVRDVTEKEARKIGINVRVVNAVTGEQVGLRKPVGDIPAAKLVNADQTPDIPSETAPAPLPIQARSDIKTYTREELELIADEDGIKGIRAIANKLDVKGVQIAQLIEEILVAQG